MNANPNVTRHCDYWSNKFEQNKSKKTNGKYLRASIWLETAEIVLPAESEGGRTVGIAWAVTMELVELWTTNKKKYPTQTHK